MRALPPSLEIGEALGAALTLLDEVCCAAVGVHVLELVEATETSLALQVRARLRGRGGARARARAKATVRDRARLGLELGARFRVRG